MLAEERRLAILEQLEAKRLVSVSDLSEWLAVSPMTIRRDLRTLEDRGALLRVRGGAASISGGYHQPPLLSRESQNALEKQAIGQAAASLVAHGDVVLIDAGTTTEHIAKNLRRKKKVVVVTNALNVAVELAHRDGVEVILVGGKLKKNEMSLVGPFSRHAFEEIHADKLFLSVAGIDLDTGLTEYDLLEAEGKQAMIKAASEVIVVCDHTKFGITRFARIAPLNVVQKVITDEGTPSRYLDGLREHNIEVIICPVNRSTSE